jgi:hypothetical protein
MLGRQKGGVFLSYARGDGEKFAEQLRERLRRKASDIVIKQRPHPAGRCGLRPVATTPRLPVWTGNCIHLVLPVDPYEDLFDGLREGLLPRSATAQRPDLIVVAMQLPPGGQPVAIELTPEPR